ncbi:hypothetical protein JCM19047_4510 [Bacillus sp. JCM 19047]|nr:hypothetical protein JCM19047_4510 [Bacillus sp. JCM 19047]
MKRNQKKLILLSVLGLLIGLFLYANRLTGGQMHAHAEKLERDAYLAEYQKIEEATAFFKNDGLDASFNVEGNGDTWKKAKQVSEALYQDSDGHFEQSWGLYLGLVADQKDVDPFLVYELLKVESGATFDEHAIGPETKYGHAYGMAQFMTNTAPWIADMAELEYKKDYLFNPTTRFTYLSNIYSFYTINTTIGIRHSQLITEEWAVCSRTLRKMAMQKVTMQ